MNWHKINGFFLILAAFPLMSCVHGKNYRFNISVEEVPCSPAVVGSCPVPQQPSPAQSQLNWMPARADQLPPGPPCSVQNATDFHHPCLAYIEFDDLGELRDRQGDSPLREFDIGASVQVQRAIDTIHAAMKDGKTDPANPNLINIRSQPVIFVFVHGWKHNASPGPPEDDNVQGVKEFLDMLREHYPDVWLRIDKNTKTPCAQGTPGCTTHLLHPIVGVYIAWRGNSISQTFPVAQQFTYFGREKTAYHVGNTSLTYALTQISATAHPKDSGSDDTQPFLIMMGHSFGGLVLERALAQSTMTRLNDVDAGERGASFADLIVYVNTAEAATDSKQVLDLMAENQVTLPQLLPTNVPDPYGKRYPQFISLSSSADQATSSALPIGHSLPLLGMKVAGSIRKPDPLVCYEPEVDANSPLAHREISDFSQGDFYMHSAPHFQPMQSHEVIELPFRDCVGAGSYTQSGNQVFNDSHPPKAFQSLRFTDQTARDSFGPTLLGHKCFLIIPKNIEVPDRPRCNGTAYFIMEVPPEIIPDHSTIFTQRLFQFLSVFLIPAEGFESTPGLTQKGVLTHRVLKSTQAPSGSPN